MFNRFDFENKIGGYSCAAHSFWPFHASHIEYEIHGRVHLKCTNQEHSLLIWFICICCRRTSACSCSVQKIIRSGDVYSIHRRANKVSSCISKSKENIQILYRVAVCFFFFFLFCSVSFSWCCFFFHLLLFLFGKCLYVNWHICSVYEFHPGGICLAWCLLSTCLKIL